MKNALSLLVISILLGGCVTTPETGGSAFIITSETEESELGQKAFAEVLSKERLSTNSRWIQILNRVGERVASVTRQSGYSWEFKLIESRQKNAFCLPGGKVAFYSGIFSVAENEAGLAAVMGHEVAHAVARHGGQRITMAFGAQLAIEGLNSILGGGRSNQKDLLLSALGIGLQVGVALPFSRANESEADLIGVRYMARAGYDPREAARFWQRFARYSGASIPFLSTHPSSADRATTLEKVALENLATYQSSARYGLGETL